MTRHLLLPALAVAAVALVGCSPDSPDSSDSPGDDAFEQAYPEIVGEYEVSYSDPTVVASVGFLSATAWIGEVVAGEGLFVTLDFVTPDTDFSSSTGSGIGIGRPLRIDCFDAEECFSTGGSGRIVVVDGHTFWNPSVVWGVDGYTDGCAPELVPSEAVLLADVEYGDDGRIERFTVPIAYLVNESHRSSDPDEIAGGPCSMAALVKFDMTAVRTR